MEPIWDTDGGATRRSSSNATQHVDQGVERDDQGVERDSSNGERRRCPGAEPPRVMTCSCMDMHHESYMHIMIMSYDDESLGGAQGKRGKGDSGRERLGKRLGKGGAREEAREEGGGRDGGSGREAREEGLGQGGSGKGL